MIKIKFHFSYVDGIVATAQVLFIKIRLFPKKKKRIRKRDYEIKRFRKRTKRKISKVDRASEKKRVSVEKKKLKKAKKAGSEGNNQNEAPKKKRDIKPLVRLLMRILRAFVRKFPGYLQTEVRRLVIGVSTDDASKTAITYGCVVQSVQYTVSFIKAYSNLRQTKDAVVSVYPDFLRDKSKIELDITLSIRIWQVLRLAIELVIAYFGKGIYKVKKTEKSGQSSATEALNNSDTTSTNNE